MPRGNHPQIGILFSEFYALPVKRLGDYSFITLGLDFRDDCQTDWVACSARTHGHMKLYRLPQLPQAK